MPEVIVPIGMSMGPRFRYVRPPDPQPECYEIHLADDIVELTATEAAVWGAASYHPDRHARLEVDRKALVDFLTTAPRPITGAAAIVDDLLHRGLLLAYDTDGPLEPVFRAHRLFPLGQGLGATAEDPHLYRVGVAGQPVVSLPNAVYIQWSFSFLHPDLWTACAYYADDSEDVAGDEPLRLTAESVARELAIHLPIMLVTTCAFLDPVISG